MAHSFDFDFQDDTISPETATPASQRSPRKSQQQQRRWSTSTDGSKADYHKTSSSWEAPPVPPIPQDQPTEAWRRRSMKRDSYTSQMSLRHSESETRTQTPDNTGDRRPSATISLADRAQDSSVRSHRAKRASRMPITSMREKGEYDELHWQISGLNPKGWSQRKKWMHTLAAGGVAFTVLFSSSIVAPAKATIENSFSTSPIVAILSTALYVLGLAFGSTLGSGSSALVGRKIAQSSSLLLCVAFSIASACVHSFTALHVCRFFAGLFASPALWISHAILFEFWTRERLAIPLVTFMGLALCGITLGPVAGSYIIQSQNVRWTQYTIIIACAISLALVLAMRETHKDTVQRRRREARHSRPPVGELFEAAVVRPLGALAKNLTVLLMSTYAGITLGLFYTAFVEFSSVFESAYHLSLSEQGLTFLSMLVGIVIGAILLVFNDFLVYRPRVTKSKQLYDAEVERALSEEKQRKRLSRRNSRASSKLPRRKSTLGLFSGPPIAQPKDSRISLIQAFTKHENRPDLPQATTIDFEDKNVALAVAAAEHLNSVNEKRILPERILLILSKEPPFSETCEQLESFGLRVDRVKLAQVFLDALQQPASASETRPPTAATPGASTEAVESQAFHHANTAAALENTPLATPAPVRPVLRKSQSTYTLFSTTSPTFTAPPVWRLWPALPASLIAAGGLFMFAWTAWKGLHWIVPIIGMGLFAAGGAVVLVCTMLYTLERHGEEAIAGWSVVVWFLAAVLPIAAVPLFQSLTTGIAGSVLGGISLAFAVPTWAVVVKGGRR